MKRRQLIEFHEQKWMPKFFRDSLTDFLQMMLLRYKVYDPAVELLNDLVEQTKQTHIIDLCSGGTGPLRQLHALLESKSGKDITLELTDLYPNLSAFTELSNLLNDKVIFESSSLDARNEIMDKNGIRLFFSSFHHFNEQDAKMILNNVVKAKAPICVLEFTENSFLRLFEDLFIPISVLLLMPRTKRFGLHRFIFTYLIPILPILIVCDSIVSNLRSYSPKALSALTSEFSDDYIWKTGKIRSGFRYFKLTYMIGYPK